MTKKMPATEFRDLGYLQEVNRQFLHPLGLAMYVNAETGEYGILDAREDLEGFIFTATRDELLGYYVKADAITAEIKRRLPYRRAAGIHWIQWLSDIREPITPAPLDPVPHGPSHGA
jgi:hypothetical protein